MIRGAASGRRWVNERVLMPVWSNNAIRRSWARSLEVLQIANIGRATCGPCMCTSASETRTEAASENGLFV